MKLSIDSIQKAGAFTGGPIKSVVEWEQDGDVLRADVWIRPLSYHTTMTDAKALRNGDDIFAYRLSQAVCHEDGSPVFQASDVTGMDEDGNPILVEDQETGEMVERGALSKALSDALIKLVNEVSGLGKTKKGKNSGSKKSSGTN